ncbi:MAG: acyl-CoA dehydratase activase [Candidatus Thermoplasmatota archaeon]
MAAPIVAGVDVGSTTAKCAILQDGRILGTSLSPVGVDIVRDAERSLDAALVEAHLTRKDLAFIAGTGYGRYKVRFGQLVITEISCHAKGAVFLFPKTRLVVDIGGQDTKAIRVNASGEVVDFAMNDKCAAGTGRFLDVCAGALGYDVSELGALSLAARKPMKVTSTCTVFAESEVQSYLARGKDPKDIIAGLHASIANRSLSLIQRVGIEEEVTFTGGVSRNEGMVQALNARLGTKVNVNPLSQHIGAIGAALFAAERAAAPDAGKVAA